MARRSKPIFHGMAAVVLLRSYVTNNLVANLEQLARRSFDLKRARVIVSAHSAKHIVRI